MKTEIIKINDMNIDDKLIGKAGQVIRNGGLVAFPTETVYGIGANALDEEAVKNIFIAKGRPSDNPLIIHIGEKEDVNLYAKDISDKAYLLMDKFWPGPLTLVLNKKSIIPRVITGDLDTVAIRMPSNPIAKKLICAAGSPVAAPSANLSGKPSPTIAKHVIEDLTGKVDIIIDGGSAHIGLESTVVDLTSKVPMILRPGSVTKEMIKEVIGQVVVDKGLFAEQKYTPKSPGMKYTHYSPKGRVIILYGDEDKVINKANQLISEKEKRGIKTGVISTNEDRDKYLCENIFVIGSINNHEEVASNLFKVLRQMDEYNIEYIYSRPFIEEGIGVATMNRLIKAAGGEKIIVKD